MKRLSILAAAFLLAGPALAQSGFGRMYDPAPVQPVRPRVVAPDTTGSIAPESHYNGYRRRPVAATPPRSFEAPSLGQRPVDSRFNRGG